MRRKLVSSLRRILAVTLFLGLCIAPSPIGATPATATAALTPVPTTGQGHDPGAGERFFYAQRAGRARKLPPDYLLKARQQLLDEIRNGRMPVVGQKQGTGSLALAQATTLQGPWSLIGPAPIQDGIVGGDAGPYPIAGRVTALAVQDLNTAYLGAADGGVWKTTNGGGTWTPITDNLLISSLSIGAIALDPNNAATLYVGLGEQNFNPDVGSLAGLGILKSTDGGSTWTLSTPSFLVGQRIGRIAVDPNNSQNIYAAVSNGLAFSTDGGAAWQQAFANQQPAPPFANLPVTDVVVDSTSVPSQSTVYFAVGSPDGNANNGVYATQLQNGQLSAAVL